ncbi:MAG: family NAD(P)-dependent oxidoreductase [Proteobacteria bacterium]|nr:family NAD(P)-dependent oxidoreductase [Pseudomonadota bacterium]
MEIKGLVAVITGGASGIGESVAKDMAKAGAKVVIGDLAQEAIDRVVGEIKAAGGQAAGVVANVTSEADMAKLMDTAVEQFGAINVVVANAGVIKDGVMINTDKDTGKVRKVMSVEDFKFVVDVNLVGAFLTFREGARRMVDNNWPGVLIVVSSINKTGQVGQINYSSTKVAVALWPKILAGEFLMKGITNIRVLSISPGYVATPILMGMDQNALSAITKDVHIQRLVKPEEISSAIIYGVENDAIDATDIEVTGGLCYSRSRAK